MAGDPKVLKVTVGVEEAQFSKLISMVRQATSEVSKLVTDMNKLGGGVNVGARSGMNPGSLGATQPRAGLANNLTKSLTDTANLFKNIAQGSRESLKVMTDVVRDNLARQRNEVASLEKSIRGLGTAYEYVDKKLKSGMISPEQAQRYRANLGDRGAGYMADLDKGRGYVDKLEARMGDANVARAVMRAQSMAPEEGIARYSFGQRISRFFGGSGGGGGNGLQDEGPDGEAAKRKGGFFGMPSFMRVAGLVGMGATAIAAEYGSVPQQYMAQATRMGASFGGDAMSLKAGQNLKMVAALRDIMADPNKRGDLLATGDRAWTGYVGGTVKGLLSPLTGGPGLAQQFEGVQNDAKLKMLQMAHDQVASDPLRYAVQDYLQSTSGSQISLMRGLGMGESRMNQAGGVRNGAMNLVQRLQRAGFDPGTVVGQFRGMEGIAGRGVAQGMIGRAVYADAGGLYGAGNMMGAAAVAGGNSGQFLSDINSLVGKTTDASGMIGMDVAAANKMGTFTSQQMMNGGPMTNGYGMLGAMSVYGTGSTSAEDMRLQSGIQAGYGAYGNLMGGNVDAYQQGRNLLSAIQANPNGSIFSQEYMATKMSPRMMMDILGNEGMMSGKTALPTELSSRGYSAGMIDKYYKSTMGSVLDRAIEGGGNTAQGSLARELRANGVDFRKLMADATSDWRGAGIGGKEMRKRQTNLFQTFGTFLEDSGLASNAQEAEGMARLLAGTGATFTGSKAKGRGAYDAAQGTTAMKLNEVQVDRQIELQKEQDRNAKGLRGDAAAQNMMGEKLNAMGQLLGQSADDVASAFENLAKRVNEVTKSLGGTPGATHPKAGPKPKKGVDAHVMP